MKVYMFRTAPLSIIRSLFTTHSAMVYVIQVCRQQDQDGTAVPSWSCSKAVYKPVWHMHLLSVQWINSRWWTGERSETCRASRQNKFMKLVHLVGFKINKFVTMHGHMNIKQFNRIRIEYSFLGLRRPELITYRYLIPGSWIANPFGTECHKWYRFVRRVSKVFVGLLGSERDMWNWRCCEVKVHVVLLLKFIEMIQFIKGNRSYR
jgi:hypothetical protein